MGARPPTSTSWRWATEAFLTHGYTSARPSHPRGIGEHLVRRSISPAPTRTVRPRPPRPDQPQGHEEGRRLPRPQRPTECRARPPTTTNPSPPTQQPPIDHLRQGHWGQPSPAIVSMGVSGGGDRPVHCLADKADEHASNSVLRAAHRDPLTPSELALLWPSGPCVRWPSTELVKTLRDRVVANERPRPCTATTSRAACNLA
jgi:hypothetical protein